MDKALVFGTKDCRFESCQDHLFLRQWNVRPANHQHDNRLLTNQDWQPALNLELHGNAANPAVAIA